MADEFTPEASVDFETLAELGMLGGNGNGDGPHLAPPPEQAPPAAPPVRPRAQTPPKQQGRSTVTDPFVALEEIIRDQTIMSRELGDINAKLGTLQLQAIVMFGSALLLAVVVWKFARSNEPG